MLNRKFWTVLGLVFAAAGAQGQINVQVLVDEQYYLPGEAINIGIKISNYSGQTLTFGADPEWVNLSVETGKGYLTRETGRVSVPGEFKVESTTAATRRFDITPFFDLSRPGNYVLKAHVRVQEWGRMFAAKPVKVDILNGARTWERVFGVPPEPGAPAAPPEVRKYALLQITRQNMIKLYATITNESDTEIYATVPLTKLVSFSRPEPQIDSRSNLHVLCQNGRISFNYSVLNPDGKMIIRQTYANAGTGIPKLQYDSQGNVGVVNGVRMPQPDDLPPSLALKPPPPP